jgi:hypothetical protein
MRGTKHRIELADQLAWAWVNSCGWIPRQLHAWFWQFLCQRCKPCRGGAHCTVSQPSVGKRRLQVTLCRCTLGVLSAVVPMSRNARSHLQGAPPRYEAERKVRVCAWAKLRGFAEITPRCEEIEHVSENRVRIDVGRGVRHLDEQRESGR